jgi:hypothetical protein
MTDIVSENYAREHEGWAKIMHHYFKDDMKIQSRKIDVLNRIALLRELCDATTWEKSHMAKLRVMFALRMHVGIKEGDVIKKKKPHGISER